MADERRKRSEDRSPWGPVLPRDEYPRPDSNRRYRRERAAC
jgi:hypothetical protein